MALDSSTSGPAVDDAVADGVFDEVEPPPRGAESVVSLVGVRVRSAPQIFRVLLAATVFLVLVLATLWLWYAAIVA